MTNEWGNLTDHLEAEIRHILDHDGEPKLEFALLTVLNLHTPDYKFMGPNPGEYWVEECKHCDKPYPCPTADSILKVFA